ncbi:MAG: cell division protein SepF [Candidatus Aenigmarchaeota archaeon]|nr:cell division protein SepF [Candidatus Aenigmarchaeota archaeon]
MADKAEESPDFIELNESFFDESRNLGVVVENLRGLSDATKIQETLRQGKIVVLRIKALRETDINELKRSVDRLKKTITASDGDIAGVDEDLLILTPSFAKVYRG